MVVSCGSEKVGTVVSEGVVLVMGEVIRDSKGNIL